MVGNGRFIKSWPGFKVFDSVSGEDLTSTEHFLLNEDGNLIKPVITGNSVVLVAVQRRGRYVIRFESNGRMMKW